MMNSDIARLHPGLEKRIAALRRRSVHSPENREVRAVVRSRARDACEYCLLPTVGTFNIEHVIPPGLWDDYARGRLPGIAPRAARQGPHHIDNYAWSCPFCNGRKKDRVMLGTGRGGARFFDPRFDYWPDHFTFLAGSAYLLIDGISPEGKATEIGLGFNEGGAEGPLGTRHVVIVRGGYPPAWARAAYGLEGRS